MKGKSITAENQVLKVESVVIPVRASFPGSKEQMKTAGLYI